MALKCGKLRSRGENWVEWLLVLLLQLKWSDPVIHESVADARDFSTSISKLWTPTVGYSTSSTKSELKRVYSNWQASDLSLSDLKTCIYSPHALPRHLQRQVLQKMMRMSMLNIDPKHGRGVHHTGLGTTCILLFFSHLPSRRQPTPQRHTERIIKHLAYLGMAWMKAWTSAADQTTQTLNFSQFLKTRFNNVWYMTQPEARLPLKFLLHCAISDLIHNRVCSVMFLQSIKG